VGDSDAPATNGNVALPASEPEADSDKSEQEVLNEDK
jgi:hypothetical protein